MLKIQRSALVGHPAMRMFDLVNDVAAYPRRFGWCRAAEVIHAEPGRMTARLDLGLAGFQTWFTTDNLLERPHVIDMDLRDGPFRHLHGRWRFTDLSADACKVELSMDFEPRSRLFSPMLGLGMQALADRMVDDFIRVADQECR